MLNTADKITCTVLFDTSLDYHFEGRCEDCDASRMCGMTLGQVEERYWTGRLSQDQYEAWLVADAWLRYQTRPSLNDAHGTGRIARKMITLGGLDVPGWLN